MKVLDAEFNNKPEQKQVAEEKVERSEISIDDFDKVKLAIGKVVESVNVEGSTKLLKNTVLINGKTRTIVSGIAQYYKPEDIVGKQVVVVENLKPIKLKGILSEGMILCAVDEKTNKLSLVSPICEMPDGSVVISLSWREKEIWKGKWVKGEEMEMEWKGNGEIRERTDQKRHQKEVRSDRCCQDRV